MFLQNDCYGHFWRLSIYHPFKTQTNSLIPKNESSSLKTFGSSAKTNFGCWTWFQLIPYEKKGQVLEIWGPPKLNNGTCHEVGLWVIKAISCDQALNRDKLLRSWKTIWNYNAVLVKWAKNGQHSCSENTLCWPIFGLFMCYIFCDTSASKVWNRR